MRSAKIDNSGLKTCLRCKETKTVDGFHISRYHGGFYPYCKQCRKIAGNKRSTGKLLRAKYLFSIGLKKCSVCKLEKPLDEFYINNSSISGRAYRCKECYLLSSNRGRWLSKYNITESEYDTILQYRENKCAICKRDNDGTVGKHGRFHVDHDHTTGKVRGILCQRCNQMLGCANDNVEVLLSAIEYLQNPPANKVLNIEQNSP
jgi:hypothetical protein